MSKDDDDDDNEDENSEDNDENEIAELDFQLNLLAMRFQQRQSKHVTLSELWEVWSLLDSMCYNVNGRCTHGIPPLVYAASRGSVLLLRLLLNYHADINGMTTFRETAIISACRKQRIDAIRFLVSRGANLDLIDTTSFSALRWAVTHGDTRIVRLLLRHKVSVTRDCYTTNSAMEIAMKMASTSKKHAKILLELQRQLLLERHELLKDVIRKDERKQKKKLGKLRRKLQQKKEQLQQSKVCCSKTLDPCIDKACNNKIEGPSNSLRVVAKHSLERSPFRQLELTKSPTVIAVNEAVQVRNHSVHVITDTKEWSRHEMAAPITHKNLGQIVQTLTRTDSLKNLLHTQFSPTPTSWIKKSNGKWEQVVMKVEGISVDTVVPFSDHGELIQDLKSSNSKWTNFIKENNSEHNRPAVAPTRVFKEIVFVEEFE